MIGIVVGLAVAAVSIYTATLTRLGECAVLKAIGMSNHALYSLVSRQSLLTVLGGFALALALVTVLALGVPLLNPDVDIAISARSILRTAGAPALIALLAAFVPARRCRGPLARRHTRASLRGRRRQRPGRRDRLAMGDELPSRDRDDRGPAPAAC